VQTPLSIVILVFVAVYFWCRLGYDFVSSQSQKGFGTRNLVILAFVWSVIAAVVYLFLN